MMRFMIKYSISEMDMFLNTIRIRFLPVFFSIAFFALVLAGCPSSFDNLVRARNEGMSVVYPINEDQAWHIANDVFIGNGARKPEIEVNKSEQTINWVGFMIVQIQPLDNGNTKVTAKQAPSPCSPATPVFSEKKFHESFAETVKLMESRSP